MVSWKEGNPGYFRGVGWFTLSLVVGVTNDVLMKFLGNGYEPMQIVCLRYFFASLSIWVMFSRRKGFKMSFFSMPKLHVIRAIFLLSAIASYCFALGKLPIAVVSSLNFSIPIFTLIFARIFLSERIGIGSAVATIIGFLGICVVLNPSAVSFFTTAAWTLLLSPVLFASLDVINKKFVCGEGIFQMVFYTATVTFFLSIPFALHGWVWPSLLSLCLFAALGVGANLLLYCMLKSLELVKVSSVAPLRYVEFILTVLVGFLIFGEIPSKSTVIGSLAIITSSVYIVFQGAKE